MSRSGDGAITVKGPLGTLTQKINPLVAIRSEGAELLFKAADESRAPARCQRHVPCAGREHGQGVTKGFEKKLTLVGTGYRAQAPAPV
jgi:large subunit ribosomal protein L6